MDASEAPAQPDTPQVHPHVFELADILRDAWQPMHERLVASGVPLNEDPPATADPPASTETPGTTEPQVNWEKRYNDLRPEFDRKSAAAAEYERLQSDPEAQQAFLAQLGYEVEQEPEPVYDDPADELRAQLAQQAERIAQQEARWDTLTAEQQQREQLAGIEAAVAEQFKAIPELKVGDNLSAEQRSAVEHDRALVESYALVSLPPREDGTPDIAAAYKALSERDERRTKQPRAKPRPTYIAPGGTEGTHAPNLDDRQTRREYMARKLEDLNSA